MGQKTYRAIMRILAGGLMAVLGIVLLIGAYTFRLAQAETAANAVTGPLTQNLSLIFMAIAGVFIVAGLFVSIRALRRVMKAQQMAIGAAYGDPDGPLD